MFVLMIQTDHEAFEKDPVDAVKTMLCLIAKMVHKGKGGQMADLDGKEVASWEMLSTEEWAKITGKGDDYPHTREGDPIQ